MDRLVLLDVDRSRADLAADLLRDTRLRAADAIHLATATEVQRAGVEVTLASWDRRLHPAAQAQGFGVVPAAV